MRQLELKAEAGELLALLSFQVRYLNSGLPEFGTRGIEKTQQFQWLIA
jgi:hypothetical protein